MPGRLPRYRREDLPGDLLAALTGAAILVPQSMAYAQIAQLPPVVGLYASVVPLLVYSLLGRTPQLGVGPLASISILSALGVAKLQPEGSADFIALSATLAVLAGIVHLAVGIGRLGFLVRFLSEPVMTGFLGGLAILLIATQLGSFTGVSLSGTDGRALEVIRDWIEHAETADILSAAIGVGAVALILATRRWRLVPTTLLVVAAGSVLVAVLHLDDHGVAIVGDVPEGLALPEVPRWNWDEIRVLLPTAFAITLVSVLEAVALGREFAEEHDREFDTNREIAALGASNVAAGFFQGMVVTSAVSRSTIIDEAGARTQLSGALCAVIVAPLLMFGTVSFRNIPLPALAAVVIAAVIPLIKIGEARRLWRVQRSDFWVMALAFVAVLALGLEPGVLVAVGVSLVLLMYRVTRPRVVTQRHGDVAVVRFDGPLFYANAERLQQHLRSLLDESPAPRAVVLDASGIDDLDATADHALRKIAARYQARGTGLVLAEVKEEVRAVMDRSGFTELLGEAAFFATATDALASL
ncbi:MAG: SulP family inorganic anion transporter [Actinomycetota bacterium]